MGNRLRVLRAEKRLSQLALSIGASALPGAPSISATTLWKIENGYRVPTEAERQALATALGVTVAEAWPE